LLSSALFPVCARIMANSSSFSLQVDSKYVSYPPSPPLVIKTSFSARHVFTRFYLNHYQVRFYIKHDADRSQQQQTLVMFPCIVTSYEYYHKSVKS
jgi:hypothetical protein